MSFFDKIKDVTNVNMIQYTNVTDIHMNTGRQQILRFRIASHGKN